MKSENTQQAASLDSVEQALAKWRANKSNSPGKGIPDEIWLQIFSLENSVRTGSMLRTLFVLNAKQYKIKHEELVSSRNNIAAPKVPKNSESSAVAQQSELLAESSDAPVISFAEVCVENNTAPALSTQAQQTKATIKTIKSKKTKLEAILDPTTVVLECIRNDGHRLKIHTSSSRIEEIMAAFYKQEEIK